MAPTDTTLLPGQRFGEAADIFFRMGHSSVCIEDTPCAAFLVKCDTDFTILSANTKFFALLGITPHDLSFRYGNRLTALSDAEPLGALPGLVAGQEADGGFTYIDQCIHTPSGDKWLHTAAVRVEYEGQLALCCYSFDITESVQLRHLYNSLDSVVQFVTERIRYEMFIFDTATGSAQVHTSRAVLRELFPEQNVSYPGFLETLLGGNALAEESKAPFRATFEQVQRTGERATCELLLHPHAGSAIWVRFSLEYFSLRGAQGRFLMGIFEDITQEKEALRNFLSETQFFQAMLSEKAAYAKLDVTEDRMMSAGGIWDVYNEIIDKITYTQLFTEFINKVVHPDDRAHYLEIMECGNFCNSLESGIDRVGCDFRRILDQNKMVWMRISIHLFRDTMTGHVMGLLYLDNVDEEKKRQLSLAREAERDFLTNIYNKKMAESSICSYLQAMHHGELCAMMILDIDNFKDINDTYGHQVGDDVLVTLAGTLSRAFRKNDVIGRFGGDEFILFIKNIDTIDRVRERLDSLFAQIAGESAPAFSCSIGVAPVHEPIPYDELFQRADSALYAAKNAGKHRYVFYDGQHMAPPEQNRQTPMETPSEHLLPPAAPSMNTCGEALPFERFLSEAGDIAYLVDIASYELICGNAAFYDRIGITPQQCRGLKCYEVMQGRKTPCPFCSPANWSTDKFYLWRNLNRYLEQEFLIKNRLVQWEGHEVLLAIAVDISNNKSIVDSMENSSTESRDILSGIQRMTDAETYADSMAYALETIATYFRADSAQLWECPGAGEAYRCTFEWAVSPSSIWSGAHACAAVDEWLRSHKWTGSVLIENPNVMLSYSYEMYQIMRAGSVRNQRWIPLVAPGSEVAQGYIMVQNITAHFRNVSFTETFCGFIIGERKRRALIADIIHAGAHDKLTDLLNRESYDNFLRAYNGDDYDSVGVIFADFDSLKGINSRRGYHVGDELLIKFSSILRSIFPGASIFRLNGDEFLAVYLNISQNELDARLRELLDTVSHNGQFSISVGHCWDNVEKHLSVMVENATQVMHVNKKRHYDSLTDLDNTVRASMLQDLMRSLERREFEIFLQPKVRLDDHSLVGAEALIRYRHKDLGIVPPGQFIDMMERNDFIRYVDLFVFEEVCRLLEKWTAWGWETPIVSLNFSRLTLLENDIVKSVETVFSQFNVPKDRLEIEVTESFADMGKSVLSQAVGGLYQSGFSISLDDFGTKYTNLALLSSLEFNVLKLDKSLIGALASDARNQIILKNIIDMCGDLHISVIAEGVERQDQEDILRSLGCRYGQGYLYGKPMEVQEFERIYVRRSHL